MMRLSMVSIRLRCCAIVLLVAEGLGCGVWPCVNKEAACPSWALTQGRLHHAQDRLQHALKVSDLLLQLLPPGGRQLVVASEAVILRRPPLRFNPAFKRQALKRWVERAAHARTCHPLASS
jgi:hypothetical protein